MIGQLSESNGMSQAGARAVLETMIDELVRLLQDGYSFRERGFGTFKSVVREEQVGYHPVERRKMLLPRKRKIKFGASLRLKRLINE